MCLNPKTIPNKSYKPNDPLSPAYITVPCGHCEHCKNMRIAEMLFRTEWHRQMVESLGGFSFFVTLTFNTSNLNTIEYRNKFGEVCNISTWNNRAVCLFLKRYRKLCSSLNLELSYIITPERGKSGSYIDDRGRRRNKTSRPHYHCILYHSPIEPIQDVDSVKRSLWLALPCCWSTYKKTSRHGKDNYAIDLSSKRPNSLYEAAFCPIGRIYNEEIGRGAAKATKYVVKYAFKDYAETCFHIDPTHIISSSQSIAFKDMCPKLLQSNGIGLYFLAWLYNQDKDRNLASSMANYLGQITDGSTSRVPRYYVQKLSRDISLIDKWLVYDDTLTWVGDHVDYLHKDGRRWTTKTETSRTDFGTDFLIEMHTIAKESLWHDFHCAIERGGFEFMYSGSQPFDPEIGNEFMSRLCVAIDRWPIASSVLVSLTRPQFDLVYDVVYHGFCNVHLLSSLTPSQFAVYEAFNTLSVLRQMNNLFNKHRGLYYTRKKYEANLSAAALQYPALFNTPVNVDD